LKKKTRGRPGGLLAIKKPGKDGTTSPKTYYQVSQRGSFRKTRHPRENIPRRTCKITRRKTPTEWGESINQKLQRKDQPTGTVRTRTRRFYHSPWGKGRGGGGRLELGKDRAETHVAGTGGKDGGRESQKKKT